MAFRMRQSVITASVVATLLAAGPAAAIDYGRSPLICLLAQSDSIVVSDVATDGDRLQLGAVQEHIAGPPLKAKTTLSIRSSWDGPAATRKGTALLFLKRVPTAKGMAWALAGPNRTGLLWIDGGSVPNAPVHIPGYSETVPTLSDILPAIRDVQACTRWKVSGAATYTSNFTCSPARRARLLQTSRLHRTLLSIAERASQKPGLRCVTSGL